MALLCPAAVEAALVIDVRAVSADGGGMVNNPKWVTPGAVGSTITFNVFAMMTGNNGDTSDEGIVSVAGSFLTTDGGAGTRGHLAAFRSPGMMGTGGSNGVQIDLDGDGDLDVGSNNNASANNFFSARSLTAPFPQSGPEVQIGTFTMTVTRQVFFPETLVNFRPRNATTAGSWFEDGTQITSANFSAGAPVFVGIPEPATAALGAAPLALGLLARRRRTHAHTTRNG